MLYHDTDPSGRDPRPADDAEGRVGYGDAIHGEGYRIPERDAEIEIREASWEASAQVRANTLVEMRTSRLGERTNPVNHTYVTDTILDENQLPAAIREELPAGTVVVALHNEENPAKYAMAQALNKSQIGQTVALNPRAKAEILKISYYSRNEASLDTEEHPTDQQAA